MSSFSCPHFDPDKGECFRLNAECIPGRPGCVLGNKTSFAFPLEERMAQRKKTPPKSNPPAEAGK